MGSIKENRNHLKRVRDLLGSANFNEIFGKDRFRKTNPFRVSGGLGRIKFFLKRHVSFRLAADFEVEQMILWRF